MKQKFDFDDKLTTNCNWASQLFNHSTMKNTTVMSKTGHVEQKH